MKKSQDDLLIEQVKHRAAFAAGCEPGQHCAIVDLGIEGTSAAACRKVARALACLNGRKGEAAAVPVIKALSSGVYTGVALGPYDSELDADLAGVRVSQALAADAEAARRAADAQEEAVVRHEIDGQERAEREAAERNALEAERRSLQQRVERPARSAAGMER